MCEYSAGRRYPVNALKFISFFDNLMLLNKYVEIVMVFYVVKFCRASAIRSFVITEFCYGIDHLEIGK